MPRDAITLSDFRVPTLSIECEPYGRADRYNIARLMEKYGDAKLPELRHVLANCPKARSLSIHDRWLHAPPSRRLPRQPQITSAVALALPGRRVIAAPACPL
jgi:hypothetical protein